MEIQYDSAYSRMNGSVVSSVGSHSAAVHVRLDEGERIHVLHPQQIIAFQGSSSLREDRFMNWKHMYRKKRLLQASIRGPVELLISLPLGFQLMSIPVEESSDLLFEFRHLLFYSEGVQMNSIMQKIRNILVTQDVIRMKFSGKGMIGILSMGPLQALRLDPMIPLFVDSSSLIAYPHHASVDLTVYGNHLASQHMHYQWKLLGEGYALIQTAKPDPLIDEAVNDQGGFIRRILREVIPFGGVFIK